MGLDTAPTVDYVVHCVASVRFDHPLSRACTKNIFPMLQILDLFVDRADAVHILHVSTAYVDPRTSPTHPLSGTHHPLQYVA